ncbi:hypothetical protein HRbin41_00401 [bacterium HR41]|nr:hypothetical protein HRbin41_00401 [bacterium HR41]
MTTTELVEVQPARVVEKGSEAAVAEEEDRPQHRARCGGAKEDEPQSLVVERFVRVPLQRLAEPGWPRTSAPACQRLPDERERNTDRRHRECADCGGAPQVSEAKPEQHQWERAVVGPQRDSGGTDTEDEGLGEGDESERRERDDAHSEALRSESEERHGEQRGHQPDEDDTARVIGRAESRYRQVGGGEGACGVQRRRAPGRRGHALRSPASARHGRGGARRPFAAAHGVL